MKNAFRPLLANVLLATAVPLAAAAGDDDQRNARINALLEANASSAAFARICEDEPTSEQLKTTTMLLLAVNGYPAHTVQMGSAKFNDVMRREVAGLRSLKDVDCPGKIREARERLTSTQDIIRGSRRDAPAAQ